MRTVTIRKGSEGRVRLGHLWVFSNEIQDFDRTIPPGEDVVVLDHRGNLLGSGTFNPSSLIAVRLHARGEERALDAELLQVRIQRAWDDRRTWLGEGANACRAVYAEGDGVPGLIVDRFGEYLSVQFLTAGIERRSDAVMDALERVHGSRGIVLRNDGRARDAEGLPRAVSLGRGEVPSLVSFDLNGIHLAADLWKGQKTGFFFDQRRNYGLIQELVRGADVLDAYCYSGAWGLHALAYGARRVSFVDVSVQALDLAGRNVEANSFADQEFLECDVLEFLKASATEAKAFELVVLDPPAFAKSRRTAAQAVKGYLNLNKWGMRCVKPGGYLVTCSCSHHVPPEAFVEMATLAAREAGRAARVLGVGRQAPDHPWIPAMPETAYLKVLLLQLD